MASNSERKWFKFLLVASVVLVLGCVAFGIILFYLYISYFPEVSAVREDWNTFGTLIGGFGSCFGAVATISTLLFLVHQNNKQQEFVEWQIKNQTFESFLSHHRVFKDRLAEVESQFEGDIRFTDSEYLYYRLFPGNSPSDVKSTATMLCTLEHEDFLGGLHNQFDRIDRLLDQVEWDSGQAYELSSLLLELASDLGFRWVGKPSDGDIVMATYNTGVNIYSLHESLMRMKRIFNVYLRFTGNPAYNGLNKGVSSYVNQALLSCRRLRRFVLYQSIPGLFDLQNLLLEVGTIKNDKGFRVLPDTYDILRSTFESREDVARLNDPMHYLHVINVGTQEMYLALSKYDEEDGVYNRIKDCRESLLQILNQVRNEM